MRGDNGLLMPVANEAHYPTLQVSMHVDVWLVKHNRLITLAQSEEPHHLKPHLQTMTHCGQLGHEVSVLHQQRKEAARRLGEIP
jgi:hypothetical protein